MSQSQSWPQTILDFWFGELDNSGRCLPAFSSRWYKKDEKFDKEIKREFEDVFLQLIRSEKDENRLNWVEGQRGLLAGIILLDQFSRNMFRNAKNMYQADHLALRYSFECIALGYDTSLPLDLRTFCYLPLMHSEALAVQERCVELFENFSKELSGDSQKGVQNNLNYAVAHRDIVARFGRFPHRNEVLGRQSTPEEILFLSEPGSSF